MTTVEWSPHVYGAGVMVMASDFPDPVIDCDYTLFTTLATTGYTRLAPVGAQSSVGPDNPHACQAVAGHGPCPDLDAGTDVHAEYLNTLENGDWRSIGLDWDTGEHVAEIELGLTYQYNCAGGLI